MHGSSSPPDPAAGIEYSVASTRDGQPLSINRAPALDLEPWVARIYATKAVTVPNFSMSCGMITDAPVIRALLGGQWWAEPNGQMQTYTDRVLYFGQHTKRMPIGVEGNFSTVGFQLKPGAINAMGGPPPADTLDAILPYSELGGNETALLARFPADNSPEQWIEALEDCIRDQLRLSEAAKPDPLSAAFEYATFEDPSQPIADFAKCHDVSVRHLERVVRRDFGLTPKFVMRRARALDMAANMCGVADPVEAEELALRYFDQSHLNREFLEFFDMSPMRFLRTPQPFMTITLETRQARRLEALELIERGGKRPWE